MPELFDILTYDHAIVENVPIETTDPDWTDVLTLTTPERQPGLYELRFSLQFTLNSTSQSFLYQFSMDGGGSWGPIYQKEVKDRSNTEVLEVMNLLELTAAQVVDVRVRCTRDGSATCNVIKAFISCDRKG